MKFQGTSPNLDYNRKLLFSEKIYEFKSNFNSLDQHTKEQLKSEIFEYYSNGWGLKLIARNVLGISYSNCRTVFGVLGIEFNRGRGVVTDKVKQFRKDKAKSELNQRTGWRSLTKKTYSENTRRGIQGYYFNSSTNSYVWLRSSWEYIYAKFLNKISVNWKSEVSVYELSDGTYYRPDFFIYDSNWDLVQIVEIKGYFDNRSYKVDLLKSEYSLDVVLITDIKKYISSDTNLTKEGKTWKAIRKSKEFISQELK
jgi:hypothetical protein